MKRSVFISLLASLAMISCTNDTPDRYGNRDEKEFSFSAYQENQDTRSEVKDAGSIIMWSVDDKISVFTGGKNAEFVSGNTEPSTTASFTGTLSGSENDAYALYPYDPEATFSEGRISTSIPSEQVAKAGSFDPAAFVAVAKADKGNLMFKNVCGGVRFSVSKPGVKKVEISGNNNESLSGLVTISLDKDGTPSVVISNGFSTITVSSPSQDGFEPGVWYYATIVPVSLPDGFRMILRTENEYASYKHGFVEVKRSIFGSISNVDSGLSYISEQQAEDEMDDIHSLIVGNINDENCEDLLAALASQIEQNESVEKYSVSEDFASVTFKDGVTCDYPINNGSIFDEISKSSSQSGVRFKAQRTSGILDSKFNKEIVPNVVIFNIHHGDENRANQNALMERVYDLFGGENNDKQVYSVGYFGYKEFTAENLYQATKKAKVIIISTLGTDKGESIAVYDPATYFGGYGFPLGYVIHKDKLNVEDPYTHKEILRNTVDVQKLLDDVPDESPLRFIYFASCNTLKKDIRIKKRGLTVAGWDGVNKAGEAFAYIMTDYAVNYGLSWKMFKTDFENSKGDIEDPIKSGTHLVFKGDASNDADIILNANDRYSWKLEKENADLSITEPENGARIRKGFFSGNYNVTVKINWPGSIEKGHQETVDGIFYNLNIDDFSGKKYTDVSLVFKDGKASYSVKNLTPGVIKITVPASSTVKSHWLHKYSDDCVYALVSKDFEKNDGETFEDMPAPKVVTFDVKEDGNAHIVRCAVINQDASELTKGVKFWPKSNPSDFHEIESNEKKSGYTVKLPELVQGETYCVQGFADGESDGIRYYGDVLEFQNGHSPIECPLTFTATGESQIYLEGSGEYVPVLEYSLNGGSWKNYTIGDPIPLYDGDKVSFRAGPDGNSTINTMPYWNEHYSFKSSYIGEKYRHPYGTIAASGNIMSLLDASCKQDAITVPGCFARLFYGFDKLTSAPSLPATTLSEWCYIGMFHNCSSMTSACDLPATIMKNGCYASMFSNTSIDVAPALPATTLAAECYAAMFSRTKIVKAPELPAATLAPSCYESMFSECKKLTSAPVLPATNLEKSCYSSMFEYCSSLTTAPMLPATQLKQYCYYAMFESCTSLTEAPELPATYGVYGCYNYMFRYCSNLNEIKAMILNPVDNTDHWLDEVSPTGTFYRNPTATWSREDASIPDGWSIELTGNGFVNNVKVGEAVDLGLPSGLKWASWNLGASAPEGYGDYFAWGETIPKTQFTWANYKWMKSGYDDDEHILKYFWKDNDDDFFIANSILEPEDDAAHIVWGEGWHLPSESDWMELKEKCTWTAGTKNGIKGYTVTGKNGNSIFIPAAGAYDHNGYQNVDSYLGPLGAYWSNHLLEGTNHGCLFSNLS